MEDHNEDPLRKKRERVCNFTTEEVERLLSLIESRRHILESKKNDTYIWQEKEKAWNKIEKGYNSLPNTSYRSSKQLKLKYEALKRGTRKAMVKDRVRGKSGLSAIEQKVKKILSEARDYSSGDEELKSEVSELPSDTEGSISEDEKPEKWANHEVTVGSPERPEPEARNDINVEASQNNIENKYAGSSKPKVHRLLEARLEAAQLQKQLLLIDIEQKSIQRKIYQEDLEHKRYMNQLQKEEMRLKIELLKRDLASKDANQNPNY